MMKSIALAGLMGLGLMMAAGAAQAGSVPAGTISVGSRFAPTVDLVAGTITLQDPSFIPPRKKFDFHDGTGRFSTADSVNGNDAPGLTSGATLSFDMIVGNVVDYTNGNALSGLLTFTDGTLGETYAFSLDQSITTLSNQTTGAGTTIGLYLLGDLTGAGAFDYSTPTATALTLSLTKTGSSAWSLSGTLSNPPPGTGLPVPEPASMTILGGGLAVLSMVRRRRSKK